MCGLGQTAANPVLSTLRYFRNEYERHIVEQALRRLRLPGADRRAVPVGVPARDRGVALRRPHRPRRVRGGLPGDPRGQPVPVGLRAGLQPPVRGALPGGDHGRRPGRRSAPSSASSPTGSTRCSSSPPRTPVAGAEEPPVAVVGSGPAGLTAAHYLSLQGYRVTVFEADAEPGGMLFSRHPRLPAAARGDEEGDRLAPRREHHAPLQHRARPRRHPRRAASTQGFEAVFVALGAHKSLHARPARRGRAGRLPVDPVPQGVQPARREARPRPGRRHRRRQLGGRRRPGGPAPAGRRERDDLLPPHAARDAGLRGGDRGGAPGRRQHRAARRAGPHPHQGRPADRHRVRQEPLGDPRRERPPPAGPGAGQRVHRPARHPDRRDQRGLRHRLHRRRRRQPRRGRPAAARCGSTRRRWPPTARASSPAATS